MQYIIGDVHGELELLDELITLIKNTDSKAEFLFVGDFVDRGPDSKGVVDRVIEIGGKYVRGNHDDIFDLIINGEATTGSGQKEEAAEQMIWFMNFGMADTLKSYGIHAEEISAVVDAYENNVTSKTNVANMFDLDGDEEENTLDTAMAALRARIPQTHKDFFRKAPLIIIEDDFFIVHAHVPGNEDPQEWASNKENAQDMIWGRFSLREIHEEKKWHKWGYFGHTPTHTYGEEDASAKPIVGNSIVLLDTGATFGYCMTARCVQTGEFFSVKSQKPTVR